MAFKQPRVPEYRESEETGKYLRGLVLFLKDFCMDVWTANNQRAGEIGAVKAGYPVTSVCGKTGDVALDAGDVGALATGGTAADSSKLGGKAPEYYLQPRNLLDNSDFTRFIAQAGIMGTHGAVPYAGDRWRMNGGPVTGVANAYGDGYTDITLQTDSRFEQVVAGIDKYYGQPMTAALWLKNGSVIVGSAIVNAPTEDYLTPISVGNDNTHIYLQATTGDARVYIFIIVTYGNTETVVAAALLPGSYTADTLPPYVPKGYAAELAACNSAPVDVGGGCGGGSLQAYPVGSIYVSATPTSPASLFGGTWEQLKDRFLLGAGGGYAAGGTGGAETVSLSVNQMPAHYHEETEWFNNTYVRPVASTNKDGTYTASTSTTDGTYKIPSNSVSHSSVSSSNVGYPVISGKTGGGAAHNNMPPYLAVYKWKRVS